MATITTVSNGNYLNSPRIQYITTSPYHNDIYQYTTTFNPQTFTVTGTLTSLATVGTATVTNCPANRVLRMNGKKLYPGGLISANDGYVGAPNPGVTTYMVGVYDPVNFLSGYIDPNSAVFAVYNTDKPEYVTRGVDPNGNAIDQGPPVYSLGLGQFGANLNVGSFISTGGTITTGGALVATTALGYSAGGGYSGPVAASQGSSSGKATAVTANGPVLNITMDGAALGANGVATFVLTNSSITANDTLIVQHQSAGTLGAYSCNGTVTAANTASISITNISGGSLSQAIVLRIFVLSS
jgi:hypothetical protein